MRSKKYLNVGLISKLIKRKMIEYFKNQSQVKNAVDKKNFGEICTS